MRRVSVWGLIGYKWLYLCVYIDEREYRERQEEEREELNWEEWENSEKVIKEELWEEESVYSEGEKSKCM